MWLLACVAAPSDSALPTSPDSPTGELVTLEDVAYTPPPGVDADAATLDITWLDDGQERPLVLLVHGGSWVGGDKSNFAEAAPDFIPWWLDAGYNVAAVNFRLASPRGEPLEVGPKDQARDIAHALAWLDANAADHGLADHGTVALGYSSGAHLVALLGADGSYLDEAGLDETHLAATVSLDVHAYDVPFALELMVDSVVEDNIPLIEHLFGTTEDEQLSGSPIHFVEGHVAPALLVSVEPSPTDEGTHGFIVSQASERYAAALRAQGHTAETFHDSDETHASLAVGFGQADDPATQAVGAFLDALD